MGLNRANAEPITKLAENTGANTSTTHPLQECDSEVQLGSNYLQGSVTIFKH